MVLLVFLVSCDKSKTYYTFYDSGQIEKSYYQPDKNNPNISEVTLFDTLGNRIIMTNYVNGKREGLSKAYYPNGKLKILQNYKNDSLNGFYRVFNKNGYVKYEALYVNYKQIAFRNYLISQDSVFEKFVSYKLLRDTIYESEGQLVYNTLTEEHEEEMSFAYLLLEDTSKAMKGFKNFTLKIINKYPWSLSFREIKEIDKMENLEIKQELNSSEVLNREIKLSVELKKNEPSFIYGRLRIQHKTFSDTTIVKEFIVYEMIDN